MYALIVTSFSKEVTKIVPHPVPFLAAGHHDDNGGLLLPGHPPEGSHGLVLGSCYTHTHKRTQTHADTHTHTHIHAHTHTHTHTQTHTHTHTHISIIHQTGRVGSVRL